MASFRPLPLLRPVIAVGDDTEAVPMTFYHGTRRGFRPGGYVFPQSFHGEEGTSAPLTSGSQQPDDAGRWAYVTTSLELAWVYAWHAPGRGRPKVLVVRPAGLQEDPEHSPYMQAFRCESARVLKVDIHPVMTEDEARSGWVL